MKKVSNKCIIISSNLYNKEHILVPSFVVWLIVQPIPLLALGKIVDNNAGLTLICSILHVEALTSMTYSNQIVESV